MPGKANCCCPARVQHSVLCPGDGGQPHRGVSQHVGEDGSEDLPVHFGAAGVRWCGSGGQVDAAVGAEVVATGESFSADETVGAICVPGLWLFGFDSLSSPLEWERGQGPCRSSVYPEVIAAAVVGGEPLGVCRPAGPPMWGLFVPAGVEPEFRL
jgi:hypothetical protein